MDYEDRLWQFVSDPMEGTLRATVLRSERSIFEPKGDAPRRGEPFRYFDGKRSSGPSSGRAPRRATWRYTAASDPSVALRMGHELWSALPPSLRASLDGATPDHPVRIKIVSDSRQVTDLPWEWLTRDSGPVALDDSVRLVRSIPLRFALPPLAVDGRLKVLAVISDPKDEVRIDVLRERQMLEQAIRSHGYELSVLINPEQEQLVGALASEPHIVHYVGHAGSSVDESGSLILPSDEGLTHWIDASTVARVLPSSVRLLCVGSCFTAPNYDLRGLLRFAYAPPSLALPTFVTNQTQLWNGDRVLDFWRTFYHTLHKTGETVEAIHRARRALAGAGGSACEWGSFSAVLRDNSGVVFTRQPAAGSLDEEVARRLSSRLANDLTSGLASMPSQTVLVDEHPVGLTGSKLMGWSRAPSSVDSPGPGTMTARLIDSLMDPSTADK